MAVEEEGLRVFQSVRIKIGKSRRRERPRPPTKGARGAPCSLGVGSGAAGLQPGASAAEVPVPPCPGGDSAARLVCPHPSPVARPPASLPPSKATAEEAVAA